MNKKETQSIFMFTLLLLLGIILLGVTTLPMDVQSKNILAISGFILVLISFGFVIYMALVSK